MVNFTTEFNDCIKKAVEDAVRETVSMVEERWRQEASLKLNSTYSDYVSGLSSYVEVGNGLAKGGISLNGELPQSLEKGYPGFDMKPGFANSPSVKRGKNGNWYLSVPVSDKSTKTIVYPSRDNYGVVSRRTTWNRTGKGANQLALARMMKADNAKNNFRTVSSNSPSDSWQHPGFSGVHLFEYMEQFAKTTFNTILISKLRQL